MRTVIHSTYSVPPLEPSDVDKMPTECRDLCLLLLCCGDVETNPGPDPEQDQSRSSRTGMSRALLQVTRQLFGNWLLKG